MSVGEDHTTPSKGVLIDQGRIDLWVIDERTGLPLEDPNLIVAVDPDTRTVLGCSVVSGTATTQAAIDCLRQSGVRGRIRRD